LSVKVHIDTSELEKAIGQYSSRVKNFSMDIAGTALITATDDLIQSEGAKGTDGPWDPFSPETLRRHPRRVGGKLLQDTGLLANIQTTQRGPESVTIASPAPYAGNHLDTRDFFALKFGDVLDDLGNTSLQEIDR